MVFPVRQEPHIVQLPAFIPIIFIVQIVLSVLILALAAYGISVFSYSAFGFTLDSDFTSVLALILVASILTWIILGYTITSSGFVTHLYNKWAVLALLSLETIFWFAGFIAVAAIAGDNTHNWAKAKKNADNALSGSGFDFNSFFSGSGGSFSSIFKRTLSKRSVPTLNDAAAAYDCGATTAGLGAVEFILSTVVLVYFILGLIAHRRANPSASATTGVGKAESGYGGGPVYEQQSGGPVTQEKPHEMVPVAGTPVNGGQYQAPVQPQYSGTPQPMQPQYGGQPIPQQQY